MGASEAQVFANRRNARRSTGPSSMGKARSSRNALKHGLTATRVLAVGREEQLQVSEFIDAMREALAPVGAIEELLVDKLINVAWRLRRASAMERQLILVEGAGASVPALRSGIAFVRAAGGTDSFAKLSRYETALDRQFHRTLSELERVQRARAGEQVPPPLKVQVEVP